MAKFRNKPVVIEAEQFLAGNKPPRGVTLWADVPNGMQPRDMSWGFVVTRYGLRAHVHHGDWIIPEGDGVHFYPCKPDIFAATYEPVQESAAAAAE